jgi:hypothetical protein
VSSEALEFDRLLSISSKAMPLITDLSNIFDTDMTNSILINCHPLKQFVKGLLFMWIIWFSHNTIKAA